MFTPLHVKSHYSLGCGTAALDELVDRAALLGYAGLALTDLENLAGQVQFHHLCRSRGIRALTGLELRPGCGLHSSGGHGGRLVLLAADQSGYRNLCRIVSSRRSRPRPAAGMEGAGRRLLRLASAHAEGLFALSDDGALLEDLLAGGAFPISRLGLLVIRPEQTVRDRFQQDWARFLGIPLVADLDVVFLRPEDHRLHLLQSAVRRRLRLSGLKDADIEGGERWLRSPEEATILFSDIPEALEQTAGIAAACRLDLGTGKPFGPALQFGGNGAAEQELRACCQKALSARQAGTLPWAPHYGDRLEQELASFARLGLSGLMLSVAQIIGHCRSRKIAVIARGSAVSSLLLHLLGGSPVDPIAQGLLFERFVNPAKSEWPDVDLDLPWDRRDEVINWVYRHFGRPKVAMVASYHTLGYRSALREGLKALNAPKTLAKALMQRLPPEDLGAADIDFLELAGELGGEVDPLEEISAKTLWPGFSEDLALIRRLVGRPHHLAAHPGGILIGRSALENMLPLERAPKGVVVTQYDMASLTKLGMIKIDLLGNRALSELGESLKLSGSFADTETVPAEDAAALHLIDRADTVGCFQLESPAMRSLLARIPIRGQRDLVAALALIRPGAAAGAAKADFIAKARGERPQKDFDPIMADRLDETHGQILYEEDIMVLLSRIGGISLAEADQLRAEIVASGADRRILARLEAEFVQQARAHGIGHTRAKRAWSAAARFAAYAFNKAHAASYGFIAYLCAYMKVHFPLEFACALLNHHQGIYPLRTLAGDFKRRGIDIRPPRVNHSGCRSLLEKRRGSAAAVRVGLDKLKALSSGCAGRICEANSTQGPFLTLSGFIERVHPNRRELKVLILAGACDGLLPLAPEGYPFVHEAVLEGLAKGRRPLQLEGMQIRLPESPEAGTRLALYQGLVRARNELRFFEMHLSAHPLELLREEAQRYGAHSIGQAVDEPGGNRLRLFAVAAAMRRVSSGKGLMLFLTLEDETGLLEAAVLPSHYWKLADRVVTPGPFLVDGILRQRQGAVHFEVTDLVPFHRRPRPFGRAEIW